MKIKFDINDGISRSLQRLRKSGQNLTPVMNEISQTMLDETVTNFDDQGRPVAWPGLAEATIKRRGATGPILYTGKQGGLRDSISAAHGADFAEVRANKAYARIHHLGGMAGRGRKTEIPPRPYFYISDDGWDEIMDSIAHHFQSAADG
ncbi:MAG: phage virion morphogenesis protein [Burkholderiales bacterium]|jgi:phage virion morphogenesis protein|nr:phage virion morphogenesis protein [Burkholderiales bacterium]